MRKLFLLLVLSSILSGCGSGGGGEQFKERLVIINGAPKTGSVNVFADTQTLVTDLPYGTDTGTIEAPEGAKVQLTVTSETQVVPGTPLEAKIDSGSSNVLLVGQDGATLQMTLLARDDSQTPKGRARLSILNGAATAKAIDVYITAPTTSLKGRTPDIAALDVSKASSNIVLLEGEYRIRIANAAATTTTATTDTTVATTPKTVYDSGTFTLTAGTNEYVVLLERKGGGRPYSALFLEGSR